jgi:phosphoglycerate dehydrogenase-like enzyme
LPVFRIALTGDFLNADGAIAYGDIGLGVLEGKPWVEQSFVRDLAPRRGDKSYWDRLYSLEVTPQHIAGVDGLVVLRPWVKRSTFAAGAENLVVIGRSGAGYDKIDLQACTDHDVAVFNAPNALNHSTASSALMFMLALAKKLPQQDRVTRQSRWDLQPAVMGSEVQGRVLGIVGLGKSGQELVRLVAPFDMEVIAYSPHADAAQARSLGVRLTALEELLERSDFVSLHCRLTPETRGMLRREHLERMKPTAYLINVARGELIDQQALADLLRTHRIAGAALDVFEHEPPSPDDPLLSLDKVILSPHWSCSTSDIWRATGMATTQGMLRAARGEVPDNIVNPDVLARPAFCAKLSRFEENGMVEGLGSRV